MMKFKFIFQMMSLFGPVTRVKRGGGFGWPKTEKPTCLPSIRRHVSPPWNESPKIRPFLYCGYLDCGVSYKLNTYKKRKYMYRQHSGISNKDNHGTHCLSYIFHQQQELIICDTNISYMTSYTSLSGLSHDYSHACKRYYISWPCVCVCVCVGAWG